MAITVLKTKFKKVKPKEIQYRYYMNFVEENFRNDLNNYLTYENLRKFFLKFCRHIPN